MDRENIFEVFRSFDFDCGESEETIFGKEHPDLHYQMFRSGEEWKLRMIYGEGFPEGDLLPRNSYLKKNWKSTLFFTFTIVFMVGAFLSPLWYFMVFGALIYLALPLFIRLKIYKKILPKLREKGIIVHYEGCFDVIPNTSNKALGENSEPLRNSESSTINVR